MREARQRQQERTDAIGDGFATLARWSFRLIAVAAAVVVVGYVLGKLWVVVLPVLLALTICTALWPPTAWLRKRGWPPALAASTTVLGALVVLGAAVALIIPPVVDQVQDVANRASDGLTRVQDWLTGPPLNLSDEQINAARESLTQRLQDSASSIASGVVTGVSAVTNAFVALFIVLFLCFFFVKDGPRFLPWLRATLGERAGHHLDEVLRRSWGTLGGFFRSQAAVGLIDAVFIGVGLLIVGVPLALPLAVLTFLGGFVPIVGALVAGSLAILVALVTQGTTAALIVLAIVVAVQQVEGNILQPILQSRSLRLHQVLILLAVAAGSTLYGVAGAFFAVPVVAVAAEVLRYLGEQLDRTPGQARSRTPDEPEEPRDGGELVGPKAPAPAGRTPAAPAPATQPEDRPSGASPAPPPADPAD